MNYELTHSLAKRNKKTPEVMLLTPKEAARIMGICPRTLWGLKDLPRVRIGRAVRYDIEDIRKWIATRKTPANG